MRHRQTLPRVAAESAFEGTIWAPLGWREGKRGEGAPSPGGGCRHPKMGGERRRQWGHHLLVLELPHLLLMGIHVGLVLRLLPGQLKLRRLRWGHGRS